MTNAVKINPFQRNHLIRDGISQSIYDSMKEDTSIYLFGEGAEVKQHYDAPYMLKDFPSRVTTLPISEDGNLNFCVGASLLGIKPVYDIISSDFLLRAMDSIANTSAKLNFMRSESSTIVIRAECLLGGPTTGQRVESMFLGVPGLRVAVPSTPRDAYGLMRTALTEPGVTLFFEDRMVEDEDDWHPEELITGGTIPFGASFWRHKGQRGNVTILSYGVMCQRVARILRQHPPSKDPYADDAEMRCDLIDLRSLYPIDWGFITKMLERTGRLLIVEPDIQYGGIGAEIAATIAEKLPHVRIKRLGARRETTPAALSLHAQMLPTEEEVIDAINDLNQT